MALAVSRGWLSSALEPTRLQLRRLEWRAATVALLGRPQVANPAQGKRPSSPAPPPAAAAHQDAAAAAEDPDLVLPAVLPFKRSQAEERYPKGVVRGRHWKHLKQIIQAENYHSLPPGEPTYAVSMSIRRGPVG
eukprot:jgi/Mesen1/866/ME000114S10948